MNAKKFSDLPKIFIAPLLKKVGSTLAFADTLHLHLRVCKAVLATSEMSVCLSVCLSVCQTRGS